MPVNFFGKANNKPVAPSSSTSLTDISSKLTEKESNLSHRLNTLNQQINQVNQQFQQQRGSQKEMTKQRLLNLLKQRKMLEGQLGMVSNHGASIHQMAFNQEMISTTLETVDCITSTAKEQKMMMNELESKQDAFYDAQYDLREMTDLSEEISSSLTFDMPQVNDFELEQEFAELQQDILGVQPSIPITTTTKRTIPLKNKVPMK
ncbi:hypothetical protein RCL1_003742 [Eukaryota sp. TZLM3-RCL]